MRHRKSHCIRGHQRIPENLYSNGGCKLCKAETSRAYRDAMRLKLTRADSLLAKIKKFFLGV